ncbi:hypothetical protein Scep_022679 [Stephania cephalantha]|uniref:Uncharacterized protein n=1 Tax=Stephania cephalantha TaxID=152367 RepID=A0AAP0F5W3_9MAGN
MAVAIIIHYHRRLSSPSFPLFGTEEWIAFRHPLPYFSTILSQPGEKMARFGRERRVGDKLRERRPIT